MNDPWMLRKRVLPQHTDHAGVMWHGAYIAWLEEARVKALGEAGIPYASLSAEGLEMPVVKLQIEYREAIFHGDEVLLESCLLPREGAKWPWHTRFKKEDGVFVAQASVDLVLVRFSGSKRQVIRKPPDYVFNALKNLQLGPNSSN